jgi:hypothetical protein
MKPTDDDEVSLQLIVRSHMEKQKILTRLATTSMILTSCQLLNTTTVHY